MKLGFWTLGMPAWTPAEIAGHAAEHGYHGVDLRCTRPGNDGRPVDQGTLSISTPPDELDSLVEVFRKEKIEIASLLCYSPPSTDGPTDWSAIEDDVAAHARLATRVATNRIRVPLGKPAGGDDWASHLELLWDAVAAALGQAPGVGAVFENHPGRVTAEQLLAVAERRADPRIGVEYSPDHAMVMQEDPVSIAERFAPWIHQVCFAERKLVQEDLAAFDGRFYSIKYEECMVGDGDVPAQRIFGTLARKGFDGYVSLKWGKSDRFGHHLPPGDEALAPFAALMRSFGVIDDLTRSQRVH